MSRHVFLKIRDLGVQRGQDRTERSDRRRICHDRRGPLAGVLGSMHLLYRRHFASISRRLRRARTIRRRVSLATGSGAGAWANTVDRGVEVSPNGG